MSTLEDRSSMGHPPRRGRALASCLALLLLAAGCAGGGSDSNPDPNPTPTPTPTPTGSPTPTPTPTPSPTPTSACSCTGKQCGDDGCGHSCGTCGGNQTCNASGACMGGTPATLDALAVGAYQQVGTNCSSGSLLSGQALFVCPGKRLRGAGYFDGFIEVMCGTYTTSAASMVGCTDKVGCYPKLHALVKDTLGTGGQQNVDPAFAFDVLMNNGLSGALVAPGYLWRTGPCKDGTTGYAVLRRVAVDVTDDYCVSADCPASTGGGAGTCGTDCDCGRCWYCDKSGGTGTCRYGGEGPYGCYRGCG